MDGENALAELGDLSIPLPDGRKYRLAGGHRLWFAPEVPEITYAPDDQPVTVVESPSGLRVIQSADQAFELEKSISITLQSAGAKLVHRVANRGDAARTLAPWAITQLPVGGTAVLPVSDRKADPHGLQPNAEIVLWPYTGIADTPFEMTDSALLIESDRSEPTKVGTRLDRGWLAYIHNGLVFAKWARHDPDADYLDRGASAQCYSSPEFIELETLGPVVTLQPGDSTEHEELWRLHSVDPDTAPAEVLSLLDLDGGHPQ